MKHYSSTDCPVVVMDKESFYNIKEQAELNQKEIQNLAANIYFEKLNTNGLNIQVMIEDSKRILHNSNIVIPITHTRKSLIPVNASEIVENFKTDIVDEIVKEANEKLTDKRQNIIDEAKKSWVELRNERNTWKLLSLIFASAFFASMFVNIYLAFM